MLRNYLKIALRNLWRNKTYSAINLAGLALGLASCLLITFYVIDELSFDRFYGNADRVFRLNADIRFGGADAHYATTPVPMGPAAVRTYPQIERMARIRDESPGMIWKGQEKIQERQVYADSTLFEVLGLPLLHGNMAKALTQPGSVVITEKMAKKYFGVSDAIGKSLLVGGTKHYQVTGVLPDFPENSHLRADVFYSMTDYPDNLSDNWLSNNYLTYFLLRPGASPVEVERQLNELYRKYAGPQALKTLGATFADLEKTGNSVKYSLIALTDIHLHSGREAELSPNGSIQYVYIFSAIALFILVIACINFMNLATARSAHRAREVGVRKVLGSMSRDLIGQFLTESILLSLMACTIAVLLVEMALPTFNNLADKHLTLGLLQSFYVFPFLIGIALFTGLLAGSYPAFYLSSFQPAAVLKGKLTAGMRSGRLRSSLVVFQFFASVFLVMCTLVIYRQLRFIQEKQVGFDREQVVILNDTYGAPAKQLKEELSRISGVESTTVGGYLPVPSWRSNDTFFPEGEINQEKAVTMQSWDIDTDYLRTMGMQLLSGRGFRADMATDSNAVILNESAVRLFRLQKPVGSHIAEISERETGKTRELTVIGVVRNFNYESLREQVGALSFRLGKVPQGSTSLRLRAGEIPATLDQVKQVWNRLMPGQPFAPKFMDEAFDGIYRSEQRIGTVFLSFALMAIFIACLGLFGLSAFTAEQRTKEIGIRKVLGASITQILLLLSKDFARLVIIAALLAFPLGWLAMDNWLQGFAFRVGISWWIYAVAGLLALSIALLTIASQSIRAASVNPVKSLKSE